MNSDTKTRNTKLINENIKMNIEYFHSIFSKMKSTQQITIPSKAAF
ncbi:hypothetical protein JCM19275_1233 [Nonlabens ulvanivorans]|uniref:Uncharacterized protein n=1 Tax=Nonlabens ulvanivorans TaxID=906888 RepID=A0A090QBC7_NONUL|nr:hypothetical protein JCM19314_540 [Nonlabens ulvanivorans]GAL76491.1 hypothetical protein JCM19275_1233 [Nonlabens ulvanivorans]